MMSEKFPISTDHSRTFSLNKKRKFSFNRTGEGIRNGRLCLRTLLYGGCMCVERRTSVCFMRWRNSMLWKEVNSETFFSCFICGWHEKEKCFLLYRPSHVLAVCHHNDGLEIQWYNIVSCGFMWLEQFWCKLSSFHWSKKSMALAPASCETFWLAWDDW